MLAMMRDLPGGTVTLLFTDIEGSTRLLREFGAEYAALLDQHRRALRTAFANRGGVEVDTQGDALFYAFPRATDAVSAASEGQRALDGGRIRVRMGLHTGEPLVTGEGYVGLDVHRAARIMSAGHGGQVLLSAATAALVHDAALRDLGEHRLKDMLAPQRLYQVGDREFPPLKTLDATNLPIAAGALIGRDREVAELVAMLAAGTRLLTITGPGGIGKTRLALQVATEMVGRFHDGVFWVPMAALTDAELVLPEIAKTLGKADAPALLHDRETLLLLDNLEQIGGAAPHLGELLASSPHLVLLVTSRAPLRLSAEREVPLEPLRPDDATALFVERAGAIGVHVEPSEDVSSICRQLDALPLAIELAAARTKLMDPATLRDRLHRRLPMLTGGPRDAPERQRTLLSTIEWSHNLLDDEAKRLFRRLAVFAGGFRLEAAEEVCDAHMESLGALVDMSLLKPAAGGRFLMLETLREYAAEQLEASGEGDEIRRRHATYLAELVPRLAGAWRTGKDAASAAQLEAEAANIRAAADWAERAGDALLHLRLLTDADFLFLRGSQQGFRAHLEAALARLERLQERSAEVERLHARGTAALSYVAYRQADYVTSQAVATKSLEVAQKAGDLLSLAAAHRNLANTDNVEGRFAEARRHLELSSELSRSAGDLRGVAVDLIDLSDVALVAGDYDEVIALAAEGIDAARPYGDPEILCVASLNTATALFHLGRVQEAQVQGRETLAFARQLGNVGVICTILLLFAAMAVQEGALVRGAELIGLADRMRHEVDLGLEPAERALQDRVVGELRTGLGAAAFADASRAGERSSIDALTADAG